MSAALLGMAFRAEMGSHVAKLVLLKLVDAAEEDGTRIFPAVATVARAAQAHERTVQKLIRVFERAGLLVLMRKGGGGPGDTNEYRLDLGVLRRIVEGGWKAATGEAAEEEADPDKGGLRPPLEKGGIDDAKGGIDDLKGGVSGHPTPPLDPSLDPSLEREGAGARGQDSDPGEPAPSEPHLPHGDLLERLRQAAPSTLTDDRDEVERAWRGLAPHDRRAAAERYEEWRATARRETGQGKLPGLVRYLRQALWKPLPGKAEAAEQQQGRAAAFSRLWWWLFHDFCARYAALLADPASAASGELRRRISAALSFGGPWPVDSARRAELEERAKALRQIPVDGDEARAWRDRYRERGIAMPTPDKAGWLFVPAAFPATGPPGGARGGSAEEDVAAEAERALGR